MLTTRGLLGIIQDYMPEEPVLKVLEYLNRAYLRLAQNDIKDFIYVICAGDYNNLDLDFPYPVLVQKLGAQIPMPSCVGVMAEYFTDDLGNLLTNGPESFGFIYQNQTVTCRKINALFVRKSPKYYYYPSNQAPYQPFSPFYNDGYSGSKYRSNGNYDFVRFPCDPRPATGESPASIYFYSKPYGDAENADPNKNYLGDIYCEFWFTPPSLSSPDSRMLLDVDKWQDELINGSVGYYEDKVNGFSERLQKFLKFDRKEFMNEGNSNLHNRGNQQYIIRDIG